MSVGGTLGEGSPSRGGSRGDPFGQAYWKSSWRFHAGVLGEGIEKSIKPGGARFGGFGISDLPYIEGETCSKH